MKDKTIWAGVLAALPPLMLAAAGWLDATAQKEAKLELADNYRQYIEEQMQEDDGLEESLASCLRANEHLTAAVAGGGPRPCEECQPCAELHPAEYPTVASPAGEYP